MTPTTTRWRKSSFSGPDTDCVELGHTLDVVRDSKNPHGPVLPVPGLKTLLTAIKSDRIVR